jgi:hypothetical protein
MQQTISSDLNISFASSSITTLYQKFYLIISSIPTTSVKLLEIDSANNKLSIEFSSGNLIININGVTKQTIPNANIGIGSIEFYIYIKSDITNGIFNIYMNGSSIATNIGNILNGEIISTVDLYPIECSSSISKYIAADTEVFEQENLINFDFLSSSIVSQWAYSSKSNSYYTFSSEKTISGKLDIDSLIQSSGAKIASMLQIASLRFGLSSIATGNANNSVNVQLSINNILIDLGTQVVGSNTSLTFGPIYTANPITNRAWTYNDIKNTRVIITSETINGALYLVPNIELDYYVFSSIINTDLSADVTVINEYIYATPVIFGTYIPTNDINASISCDVTVSDTGTISNDITSDLIAIGGLAVDINCDLILQFYTDISADVTAMVQNVTDITADVTLQLGVNSDISCDVTVDRWVLTPVDITSDVYNQNYVVGNIMGNVTLKLPISNVDIIADITASIYMNNDIACDLNFEDTIISDITCDVTPALQIYKNITADITPVLMVYSDILSDIVPCIFINSDIAGDITVLPTGVKKSYAYVI